MDKMVESSAIDLSLGVGKNVYWGQIAIITRVSELDVFVGQDRQFLYSRASFGSFGPFVYVICTSFILNHLHM